MISALSYKTRNVFYGWWVAAAAVILSALSGGVFYFGFSVFFLPISHDLGLSRSETSAVFAVGRLQGGIQGPLVGSLVDRLGPRIVILIGGTLAGAGLILMGFVHDYWSFFLVYVLTVAMGANAGFFSPIAATLNRWFVKRRATVMGLAFAAVTAGATFIVPILAVLVRAFGWRTAAVAAGIATIAITWPLSALVRRSPEEMGLLPDGKDSAAAHAADTLNPRGNYQTDFSARQALRTGAFWLLTLGVVIKWSISTVVVVHGVPMLVETGLSQQDAAYAFSLFALLTTATRLGMGLAGDKWSKRHLMALSTIFDILALFVLLTAHSFWQSYLFVTLYSIGNGGTALAGPTLGDYFGRARFATIQGFMTSAFTAGQMTSTILAGYAFDATGSYNVALVAFAAASAVAVVAYWLAKPPKQAASTAA